MKSKDNLSSFFENQDWDINDASFGHEQRFLQKLEKKQSRKKSTPLLLVASIVILISSTLVFLSIKNQEIISLSSETQQTQDYFTSVIDKELLQLKRKENSKNKAILNDALVQLSRLENDYEKLKKEIAKNGESKQLIHALLTNMQTRISFIQSVMLQMEQVNQLEKNTYENNI